MLREIIDVDGNLWQMESIMGPLVLQEGLPAFKSRGEIRDWLTLTADGQLYDIRNKQFIATALPNNKQIRAGYTHEPEYKAYLLTEGGTFYLHQYGEVHIIAEGIEYLGPGSFDGIMADAIYTSTENGKWMVYNIPDLRSEKEISSKPAHCSVPLPWPREIISQKRNVITTREYIYSLHSTSAKSVEAPPNVALAIRYDSGLGLEYVMILDNEGQVYSVNVGDRDIEDLEKGFNAMSDHVDDASPWVDFIDLKEEDSVGIVNASGGVYLINHKFFIKKYDLPRDIFIKKRLKNARTSLH